MSLNSLTAIAWFRDKRAASQKPALKIAGIEEMPVWKAMKRILDDKRVEIHVRAVLKWENPVLLRIESVS